MLRKHPALSGLFPSVVLEVVFVRLQSYSLNLNHSIRKDYPIHPYFPLFSPFLVSGLKTKFFCRVKRSV